MIHETLDDELGSHWDSPYLAHHTRDAKSLSGILQRELVASDSGGGVSFSVHPYWTHAKGGRKNVSGPVVVFHRPRIRERTLLEPPTYLARGEDRADRLTDRFGDIDVTHHAHVASEKINRKYGPWEGELVSHQDPVFFKPGDVSHIIYHHNVVASPNDWRNPSTGVRDQDVRQAMTDRDMLKSQEHAARHGVPFFVATGHAKHAQRLLQRYPHLKGKIIHVGSTDWRKSDLARHYRERYEDAVEAALAGASIPLLLEQLLQEDTRECERCGAKVPQQHAVMQPAPKMQYGDVDPRPTWRCPECEDVKRGRR